MVDPTAKAKRIAAALAAAQRGTAAIAERRARTQQTSGPVTIDRNEPADARKARQNADVMAAAEDILAVAKQSRDPSKVKAAIAAMASARAFCGDASPITGNVRIIINDPDVLDDLDDSDDQRDHTSAEVQ